MRILLQTQTTVEVADFNAQALRRYALLGSASTARNPLPIARDNARIQPAIRVTADRAVMSAEAVSYAKRQPAAAHARLRALFATINVSVNLMIATVELATPTALLI